MYFSYRDVLIKSNNSSILCHIDLVSIMFLIVHLRIYMPSLVDIEAEIIL